MRGTQLLDINKEAKKKEVKMTTAAAPAAPIATKSINVYYLIGHTINLNIKNKNAINRINDITHTHTHSQGGRAVEIDR